MSWNDSHKFECTFVTVDIRENHSVMLGSLSGSRLGIWVAHGEGKFNFPYEESRYHIPAKFSYSSYPGNPNGSMYDAACIASEDGRHLAIMPHLEDSSDAVAMGAITHPTIKMMKSHRGSRRL